MLSKTWRPRRRVDVVATLALHQRGPHDPTHRVDVHGRVWRTCRPGGEPATVCVQTMSTGELIATAWGPGGPAALNALPEWLGEQDEPDGFQPEHPVLTAAHRHFPDQLIGRTGLVMEALIPAVLEQKVTNIEAGRAWARLLRRFGQPAPGPPNAMPAGLRVTPAPDDWARIPSWEWHRAGVGPERSRTIVTAARHASRLEETATMATEEADRRLQAVPGIGPWTSAEIRQRVLGDADAVSVGDAGLPHVVAYALAGERRGTDERMLALLEPYRGHRHRACVLLLRSGIVPPRRAPKAPIRDFRQM